MRGGVNGEGRGGVRGGVRKSSGKKQKCLGSEKLLWLNFRLYENIP